MSHPLHLAYFSPLPPARSGIADYSLALLPHLARTADITLVTEDPDSVTADLKSNYDILPLSQYPSNRWNYDLALYQMGNSSHHDSVYEIALRYPGLVILHDHGLHHFIADRTVGQGNYSDYIREMGYELGVEGVHLAWDIREQRADHPLFEVALNGRLIDRSLGIAVHSRTVADMIAEQNAIRPLRIIPALMEKRTGRPNREALNVSSDTIIFASLGFVTAEKRLDLALEAFGQLHQELPNSHFLIIGDVHPMMDLAKLISHFGLENAVTCLGFVKELETFVDWVATADIIINLRHPSVGETSATALRAMAAGKPVIVFDLGWYGEMPDSAVIKVPALDTDALLAVMRQLAQNPEMRHQLGKTAAAHIKEHHDPANIAQQYLAFIKDILAGINRKFEGVNG